MDKELIMVIDDNKVNLRLLRKILGDADFEVLTLTSAEDAIETLKQIRPLLVLIDLFLPDMDGLTLTRQLKSDPDKRSIPVVAITATYLTGGERMAKEAGCDGFITKPIDIHTFMDTLHPYIQQARAAKPGPL